MFEWRRERPRPEGEAEQDHHEIDDRLDRHVHRKGRPLKRRPDRSRQNEGFERDQNARNHRAGQQAAQHAVERKQRTAFAHRDATAVNDADRRAERSEPENEPERVLQIGKRHRGRTLGCGRGSLTEICRVAFAFGARRGKCNFEARIRIVGLFIRLRGSRVSCCGTQVRIFAAMLTVERAERASGAADREPLDRPAA